MISRTNDLITVIKDILSFISVNKDVNSNQKNQISSIISSEMKLIFNLFSRLPKKTFLKYEKSWLKNILKEAPYITISPKMRIYLLFPRRMSWYLIHLFNKYYLKE